MIILAWVATVALFLIKITRYADPSWLQVFLPVIIGYVVIALAFLVMEAGEAAERRQRNKQYSARYTGDLSHIETLDSIKNPRKGV